MEKEEKPAGENPFLLGKRNCLRQPKMELLLNSREVSWESRCSTHLLPPGGFSPAPPFPKENVAFSNLGLVSQAARLIHEDMIKN